MTTAGDNKVKERAHSEGTAPPDVRLLGDLVRFIAESEDVPANQRPYLVSALKRCCTLIGDGAVDLAADPKIVLRELDRLSPAKAGIVSNPLQT